MPAISIESDEQFKHLLGSLAQELVDANIHWKLRKDLEDQIRPFSDEFNQTATFWSLTFQAQLDAAIFRLVRIYDGNTHALSLRNFLDTIVANLQIFDVDRYRDRLKGNPFVDSLTDKAEQPNADQLSNDIAFVSNENKLVQKLTIWRNNLFAHKSAKNAVRNYNIANDFPLTSEDIDNLLVEGMNILNRYSLMFVANTYSTQIVGHDDFTFLLDCVKKDLAARREALNGA